MDKTSEFLLNNIIYMMSLYGPPSYNHRWDSVINYIAEIVGVFDPTTKKGRKEIANMDILLFVKCYFDSLTEFQRVELHSICVRQFYKQM